jgi:hypothetical protein
MRNFEFDKNRADVSAANIAGVRQTELPAESLRLDEPARETLREDALSAFRESVDNEESANNTAKIAGAVLVGLLLVGGSIYAYESTTANHAPQMVAMLPPAPQRNAKADQAVTPPVSTPDTSAPAANSMSTPPPVSPSRPARIRSGQAAAKPVPATESSTPAPATTSASADPAINQPMSLTPETAPPPEQSGMQQPITAPNVSGQSAQPTPEVANNASGAATVQPDLTPPAPSETSPAVPPATPAQ